MSLLHVAAKQQPGEPASEKGGSADDADLQAPSAEAATSGKPLPAEAQQRTQPGQAALCEIALAGQSSSAASLCCVSAMTPHSYAQQACRQTERPKMYPVHAA